MDYKLSQKKGHFSGNTRLDTTDLDEPEQDNERTLNKWLGVKKEINVKRILKRCELNVSKTIDFNKLKIFQVGESHIDCAWMWRFEQTRKKAQVTFKKAILHSKMFPTTFSFALSEPMLLEWVKEDNPELFKQIQETVKKSNIELVGGSYVEPDCMMPSGEAMVRQRLYGMRFYRDNFNILPSIEWFLDSFGYNYGLPQILSKSGVKYFWTSKMTWNLITTFPFVNFWWQGPNNSRILTANFAMGIKPLEEWEKYEVGRHLLKSNGRKLWNYTLDYSLLKEHVEKEICPHIGCFFGKGDGGHGPTHKEVAYANELAKYDMFKWSRVLTFYQALEKHSNRFPIWNDELYLENHQGCFSNHAEVKRHNRKYENILVSLENMAVLTSLITQKYQYPMNQLEKLWKFTLKNQFHDVLPGSSIPEVYDEVWDDWMEQDALIEKIINDIGMTLTGEVNKSDLENVANIYLFNPVTWERKSRIFVPITIFKKSLKLDDSGKPNYAQLELLNKNKNIYICQPIASEPEGTIDQMPAGWWVVIKLNPLCLTPAKIKILNNSESLKIQKQSSLQAREDAISNNLVSIKFNSTSGAMIELTSHNINDGKNLLKGNSSNLTFGFLDNEPIGIHAWNLTKEYWNHPIELSNEKETKMKISDIGPVFTTLEITRMLGVSPVIQKISLFNECLEIFLEYLTDWKQKDIMLKVLYSTTTNAEITTADAMYCAIESKTNPEVPCDKARFEKICHNYFDLSTPDKKWGLAILNEGKYAFDVKGGDMKLTMLRACRYPVPAPEAWVNIERKENERIYEHKVPEYSGLGPFKCKYALLPHEGGSLTYSDGTPNPHVKRKAEEFNMPVIVVPLRNIIEKSIATEKLNESLLEILSNNIYLGCLKMNEWDKKHAIIARFVEGSGINTSAKVKFGSELVERIKKINAVDLLERETSQKFDWNKKTGILLFDIDKFEIRTFELII